MKFSFFVVLFSLLTSQSHSMNSLDKKELTRMISEQLLRNNTEKGQQEWFSRFIERSSSNDSTNYISQLTSLLPRCPVTKVHGKDFDQLIKYLHTKFNESFSNQASSLDLGNKLFLEQYPLVQNRAEKRAWQADDEYYYWPIFVTETKVGYPALLMRSKQTKDKWYWVQRISETHFLKCDFNDARRDFAFSILKESD